MRNQQRKNSDWATPTDFTWEHVKVEVLMDIRGELQQLNRLLACQNFLNIPATLRSIDRKLAKRRKPKKPASV